MSKALNDICFDQPHWILIAKGFNVEHWFNENQAVGTGGIKNPVRSHLNTGQRFYRFCSSTAQKSSQLGGGWWLTFDTLNTIWHYAQRNHLEFTYAARLFLALPYDWTRVDRIVNAILDAPLDAYVGEGKVAQARTEKWTPMQHLKVSQLYIPGLIANTSKNDLYQTVWQDVRFEYAHNRVPV